MPRSGRQMPGLSLSSSSLPGAGLQMAPGADGDGIGLAEGFEKTVGIAVCCQGFGVAQVGMGVHEAVFPAEKCCALGALEICLRPAVILHGPVKQVRAVGAEQVLF